MTERYRSGTPRASDNWGYSGFWSEPSEKQQFGSVSRDGKRQSKERRTTLTDYSQCSDCDWTISPHEQQYFQALKKFQAHNLSEHQGKAHLVKR